MIKSFRGLLGDGGQVTIRLGTNKGEVGYRIVKFQAIANSPGAQSQESVLKIFTYEQATVDGTVDFSNSELLGVVYYRDNNNDIYPTSNDIIFDHVKFNQDIYLTHTDVAVGQSCNYYLELEQVKLDEGEAAIATLKDMRGAN